MVAKFKKKRKHSQCGNTMPPPETRPHVYKAVTVVDLHNHTFCWSFISFSACLVAEGKAVKAEAGEVSQQHSSSKKERDREEQEINDSEDEGDLLEEEEEEVRFLSTRAQ